MRFISLILFANLLFASINLNIQNLKIQDFIKMVAKITKKNILLTTTIRGEVNFISVKPIKESEIYSILLSILKSKGYTIVEDRGYLKVIRESEAIKELSNNKFPYQMQTQIIQLFNIEARDAYTQINYLKSRYGKIVINSQKNLLIITDYPSNIKLISKILKKIDTQNKNSIIYYQLKHTQLNLIEDKIKNIASSLFDPKLYKYKIITNDTANEFILIGPKKIIEVIKANIQKLDIKPKEINEVTKIITLKNSNVKEINEVLSKIVKSKYKNPPSITANKETNSLIIIATPTQMQTITTIIQALDIPKQQVYVKTKILEISNSKASKIGAKLGLIGGAGTNGLYTLSANLGGPAIAFDVASLGIAMPVIKQGIALGASIDLLETLGAAKKLSEPSILCINNTPSSIYVGKTVSVLTGKTTSTVTSESYSRQDIGLNLKITPRIDSDNKVALKVEAIIEDILPGSVVGLPTTSKRKIETTTIVKNGQSIIIGGLVRDNKDITLNKVPLLGDIPFIGALFRHKEVNNDKTTLAIIITPYIVKRSEDLEKLRVTLSKLTALEKSFVKEYLKKYKVPKKEYQYNLETGKFDEKN